MAEGSISTALSPRAARRERELADRRRDVIAAATLVFADKGFHDAQMAEISAVAELSLASLYALFDGKEALYREVMRAAAEKMHQEVRLKVEEVADPEGRILTFVDAMFECFEDQRALLRILLAGTHGLSWRIRQNMGDGSDDLLADFYDWVRTLCAAAAAEPQLAGVDAEALTAALVGSITNLAAATMERQPTASLRDAASAVRVLFARLLNGAAA